MLNNNNKNTLLSYVLLFKFFFIVFEFQTIKIFNYNLSRFHIVDF